MSIALLPYNLYKNDFSHKTGRMIEFSSFGCEEMLEGKVRHSLDGCDGAIKVNKQTEVVSLSPFIISTMDGCYLL